MKIKRKILIVLLFTLLISYSKSFDPYSYNFDTGKSLVNFHGHWIKWGSLSTTIAGNSLDIYISLYNKITESFIGCTNDIIQSVLIEFDSSQKIFYGSRLQPKVFSECSESTLQDGLPTIHTNITLYTELRNTEPVLLFGQNLINKENAVEMDTAPLMIFRVNPNIASPGMSGIIGLTSEEATASHPESIIENGYIRNGKPFQLPIVLADSFGNPTPTACSSNSIQITDETDGEATKSIENTLFIYNSNIAICFVEVNMEIAAFKSTKQIGLYVNGEISLAQASSQEWFKDSFPYLSEHNKTTQQYVIFNFLQDKDWTFYTAIILSVLFIICAGLLFWFQFIKKIRREIAELNGLRHSRLPRTSRDPLPEQKVSSNKLQNSSMTFSSGYPSVVNSQRQSISRDVISVANNNFGSFVSFSKSNPFSLGIAADSAQPAIICINERNKVINNNSNDNDINKRANSSVDIATDEYQLGSDLASNSYTYNLEIKQPSPPARENNSNNITVATDIQQITLNQNKQKEKVRPLSHSTALTGNISNLNISGVQPNEYSFNSDEISDMSDTFSGKNLKNPLVKPNSYPKKYFAGNENPLDNRSVTNIDINNAKASKD